MLRADVEKDPVLAGSRRESDFLDKMIHASIASHYSSDHLVSFHATLQNKSNYLKIIEVQD
jgi:hypothetical protein